MAPAHVILMPRQSIGESSAADDDLVLARGVVDAVLGERARACAAHREDRSSTTDEDLVHAERSRSKRPLRDGNKSTSPGRVVTSPVARNWMVGGAR
jgi:hypothetical protein